RDKVRRKPSLGGCVRRKGRPGLGGRAPSLRAHPWLLPRRAAPRRFQTSGCVPRGSGLVVSRSSLSARGCIDAPLLADRMGESLVSGGDVEIVPRISGAGYELWYVPECEPHNRIPARRISPRYLRDIKRSLRVSQALADAL